ncbi:MAG: TetR/AcrR family transcriptional regulator [Ardenticatenaceae bacterium]|nr:TetR/AcrR family transcriptional regulator [Ardenticatenaceae bacterium]
MINLNLIQNPPSQGRPERRDAAENRQLILETADRLFAARGVQDVCMAEIAKEAGIGKGTLYRRFANKGELCLSLLDEDYQLFQNQQLARFQEQMQAQLSPIEQLIGFLTQLLYFINDHVDLLNEIEQVGLDDASANVSIPHWWNHLTIRGLLQSAVNHGEISPDADLEYIAGALLAPLDSRILRLHLTAHGFTLDQIAAGQESLVRGLAR